MAINHSWVSGCKLQPTKWIRFCFYYCITLICWCLWWYCSLWGALFGFVCNFTGLSQDLCFKITTEKRYFLWKTLSGYSSSLFWREEARGRWRSLLPVMMDNCRDLFIRRQEMTAVWARESRGSIMWRRGSSMQIRRCWSESGGTMVKTEHECGGLYRF